MAIYTGALSAQNTNVYICDVVKDRGFDTWFGQGTASGTFGSGTVTFNLSYDNGVTLFPLNQDGTSTAAALTAVGVVNLRCAGMSNNNAPVKIYASIATATNPVLTVRIQDNR